MNALTICLQARVPGIIIGAPGTGKSSAIAALAHALGIPYEIVLASIREPSDFSGLPVLIDGDVHFAPPRWAKNLSKVEIVEGRAINGLLFLDEISCAPPTVQAALLRVILDRVVGDLALPESIGILAAANPVEQSASGWELTPPLANRFCFLDWAPTPNSWIEGTLRGWASPEVTPLPEDWEVGIGVEATIVASFIKARADLLDKFPENQADTGKAWPSRRTWTMAARLIAAAKSIGATETVQKELVDGCVGAGASGEFWSWVKKMDLPDPEELLKNPKLFKPEKEKRTDRMFAILSGIATAVVGNCTKERYLVAWELLKRVEKAGQPDVCVPAAIRLSKVGIQKAMPIPTDALVFLEVMKSAGQEVRNAAA